MNFYYLVISAILDVYAHKSLVKIIFILDFDFDFFLPKQVLAIIFFLFFLVEV